MDNSSVGQHFQLVTLAASDFCVSAFWLHNVSCHYGLQSKQAVGRDMHHVLQLCYRLSERKEARSAQETKHSLICFVFFFLALFAVAIQCLQATWVQSEVCKIHSWCSVETALMLIDNMKYDRMLSYCITGIISLKIQTTPAIEVFCYSKCTSEKTCRVESGGWRLR